MPDEISFWEYLESTQQHWYPKFVEQLNGQKGGITEAGRAAVITFRDEAKPSIRLFTKSAELRRYFDSHPPSTPADRQTCRRLFVLEGLPKALVEVLGFRLCVPPSFFSEHWAHSDLAGGSLTSYPPRQHDINARFSLITSKLHCIEVEDDCDDDIDMVYNKALGIGQISCMNLFGEFELPFRGLEKLSCWSRSEGDHWDVLILVDPPPGNTIVGVDSRRQQVTRYAGNRNLSLHVPIPAVDPTQQPDMTSMFDDIVNLYPYRKGGSTTSPMISTDICRQLVLSEWIARLRLVEREVKFKMSDMILDPSETVTNRHTWLDNSWTQAWKARDLSGLVRAKATLETLDLHLLYNIDALGIGKNDTVTEEWEGAAWMRLRDIISTLKMKVGSLSEAYTQAASMQESITANKQARQVGYLTSLATFFVPMSFIAAIFSMGGDYAAGEKSFFVFWAISVPVAVVASLAFFFGGGFWKLMRRYTCTCISRKA